MLVLFAGPDKFPDQATSQTSEREPAVTQVAAPLPKTKNSDMPVSPGYKWAVVGMLWFICFFNYADRQAIAAVLKTLQADYHFSETELGYISSAFMWVYALTAP